MIVIDPGAPPFGRSFREAWAYRSVVWFFGGRLVEKRYTRTWLGRLWLVIRPLLAVVSRTLVFGGVIGIATGSLPYPLFFVVGQGAWQLFAETTYWSTRSLELSRNTGRRVYVPHVVPFVAAIVPCLIDYAVYLFFAAVLIVYYLVSDGDMFLVTGLRATYALVGLGMLVALGLGIGLWLAPLTSRIRDIRFGLGYVLSMWYVFTPVIYPFEAIPSQYRGIASLNPATGPIELVKVGMLGQGHLTIAASVISVGTITVLWAGGLFYFLREAPTRSQGE